MRFVLAHQATMFKLPMTMFIQYVEYYPNIKHITKSCGPNLCHLKYYFTDKTQNKIFLCIFRAAWVIQTKLWMSPRIDATNLANFGKSTDYFLIKRAHCFKLVCCKLENTLSVDWNFSFLDSACQYCVKYTSSD